MKSFIQFISEAPQKKPPQEFSFEKHPVITDKDVTHHGYTIPYTAYSDKGGKQPEKIHMMFSDYGPHSKLETFVTPDDTIGGERQFYQVQTRGDPLLMPRMREAIRDYMREKASSHRLTWFPHDDKEDSLTRKQFLRGSQIESLMSSINPIRYDYSPPVQRLGSHILRVK